MQSTLPATAPVEMVMPEAAQLWMNILNWGLVIVVLIFALSYWRKHGSSIGIWFLLGGALVTLNEPIVDVLGKCWFPTIGSWVFIKAWGVSVPVHMVPVYMWYVGGQAFLCYHLYGKGITQRGVFGLYALFGFMNIILETPGLNTEVPMYSYFGNQPLLFFKFPLWWMFCNALMPMMIAGVVFHFDSVLQGVRRLLVLPLSWMTAAATNALIAAPIWVALNLEASTMELTLAASVVSFVMGLMVCYGLSLTVATDAPKVRNRREMIAG
jgi:hypothetical protein